MDADAAGLRLRGEVQPLPDPHQAPDRHDQGVGACSSASSRSPPRPRWARCCGSSRQLPPRRRAPGLRAGAPAAGAPRLRFRHESWFADDVLAALRPHGVALVIGDHPERPWHRRELTTDFSFVRLHYGHRGRRGNYSATELDSGRDRARAPGAQAEVFAYFNNDWEGFAVRNAARPARHVAARRCAPSDRAHRLAPVASEGTGWKAVALDEVEAVPWRGTELVWHPVRSALGTRIVGMGGYTAERVGPGRDRGPHRVRGRPRARGGLRRAPRPGDVHARRHGGRRARRHARRRRRPQRLPARGRGRGRHRGPRARRPARLPAVGLRVDRARAPVPALRSGARDPRSSRSCAPRSPTGPWPRSRRRSSPSRAATAPRRTPRSRGCSRGGPTSAPVLADDADLEPLLDP